MITLVNDIKEANCITHSGSMHADDVFSTAFLELYLNDIKLLRTSSISEDVPKNTLVYDIGCKKFDHHQPDAKRRKSGIFYCSFGLLWEEFGKDYLYKIGVDNVEDVNNLFITDFVEAIDADDNGQFPKIDANYKVKTLSDAIRLFNPSYGSLEKENDQFLKAVTVAKMLMEEELLNVIGKVKAKEKLIEQLPNVKDHILVLKEHLPYLDSLLENDIEKKVYFVIFPSNRGGYTIKTVPKSQEDRTYRVAFPETWAGLTNEELENVSKVQGAKFCHNKLFLATCNTKESAINFALTAIRQSESIENLDLNN